LELFDYLNIAQVVGGGIIMELLSVAQLEVGLQKAKLGAKRGDYILTMFNAVSSKNGSKAQRKEMALIRQGLYLIKLSGWKNVLFETRNPIPFLKIGGEVVAESGGSKVYGRTYLMKINTHQLNLTVSPFQKVYAKL
jgi:hypothetical protein